MTPTLISALLTVLAAAVVLSTRVRLGGQARQARQDGVVVPSPVKHLHTVAGLVAIGLWAAMLVTADRRLGWVAVPLWWVTALCGLLVLVLWLPGKGRHASDDGVQTWGEGPGLAILAHGGLAAAVALFTLYLSLGLLP